MTPVRAACEPWEQSIWQNAAVSESSEILREHGAYTSLQADLPQMQLM